MALTLRLWLAGKRRSGTMAEVTARRIYRLWLAGKRRSGTMHHAELIV